MKLMRAHALLAGTQQMKCKQPFAQGNMAVSEDRSNGDTELLPASRTLPHALADMRVLLGRLWLEPIGIIQFAAVWANRAFGPTLLFQELTRCIFVAEVFGENGKI